MIDRTGERFGKLVISGKAPGNRKKWFVKCDCGEEKTVYYGNLHGGSTVSCGCWKLEGRYRRDTSNVPNGQSAKTYILCEYKLGAKSRGYSWGVSDGQFLEVTMQPCHYCGLEHSRTIKNKYGKGDYTCNGVDRPDNTRGYEPDNMVACCKTCNRAKDVMGVAEFIEWVRRVTANCWLLH